MTFNGLRIQFRKRKIIISTYQLTYCEKFKSIFFKFISIIRADEIQLLAYNIFVLLENTAEIESLLGNVILTLK